jgi:hypothetical protein
VSSGRGRTALRRLQVGDVLDVAAALLAGSLLGLIYAGGSGLLRVLLALGFALFVPGRAIVTNWPRMASWSGVAMPMVLSLAVLTLLATGTLWAHFWKPLDLFEVEAWLSLAGLSFAVLHRSWQQARRKTSDPWSTSRSTR